MRPPLLPALAALAALAAACGTPTPRVADPVTVTVPVPAVAPTAETADLAEPAHRSPASPRPRDVTGDWTEDFSGRRGGCSDAVTITGPRNNLTITGSDCHDGAPYVFSDAKFDGEHLWLQLTVPETGYVVRYTLRFLPDGALGGEAAVTGGSGTETFKVRWTRAR
jgi:hypothetical protein